MRGLRMGLAAAALAAWGAGPAAAGGARGVAIFGAIPYRGDVAAAADDAARGLTVPLWTQTTTASKDGGTYKDMQVGGSPFGTAPGATAVNILVVPVIVDIGSTVFDPTAANACIPQSLTPLAAFKGSPLVNTVVFDGAGGVGHGALINGTQGGTATFIDAFRRAEYWQAADGTGYHTTFNVTYGATQTISAATVRSFGGGQVITTNCAPLGVLPTGPFQQYVANTLLPASGAAPTSLVLFLMSDVVSEAGSATHCSNGCTIGYHSAKGNPAQTFGVTEYDSTAGFWSSPGIEDVSVVAHEMAEWLDDPLVTNPTPAWGGIGQQTNCQSNLEVGDPLTGTNFPSIKMADGLVYHPQELVFYSWYYNARGVSSIGAGGSFSMNGTFGGPSKVCPPGGTY